MEIVLVLILLIVITVFRLRYGKLKKNYDMLKQQVRVQAKPEEKPQDALKHAEYLALQNQINPHFLYNTLEAIRSDAICEEAYGIANTTKALATFFRYTITEVGYLVTLDDEISNVNNYFIIQQYRFGEKLNMDIMLPKEDSILLHAQIPKLTLQPIVENAIAHGLEGQSGFGTVKIIIEYTERNLLITIKDNGVGIDEERLITLNKSFSSKTVSSEKKKTSSKGGIALVNVNSRIKLLFGEEYGIHIFSIQNVGTEVKIILPLIIEEKYKSGAMGN